MSAPIKGQDIRKGDLIRKEYDTTRDDTGGTKAVEFWAVKDGDQLAHHKGDCFLLDRPVQLPTEPGHYLDRDEVWNYLGKDGTWSDGADYEIGAFAMKRRAPLTRVRPVAEVAAEVLAEVRGSNMRNSELDAIADKWAAK